MAQAFGAGVAFLPAVGAVFGSACVGGMTGACELIGRYRDAPQHILQSFPALLYITLNAMAAAIAYPLIVHLNFIPDNGDPVVTRFLQIGMAGISAMAFFRASVFTVKAGKSEFGVGPAVILQTLLSATDKAIDRGRAMRRSDLAATIMKGVSFAQAQTALPSYCFELMQSLSADDMLQARTAISAVAGSTEPGMNDSVKAFNLGLILMNVVGEDVLKKAVTVLDASIKIPTRLDIETIGRLRNLTFDHANPALINACFTLAQYSDTDAEKQDRDAVAAEVATLTNGSAGLSDNSKVTSLAVALQQRVGSEVLKAALALLGS